MAGQHGLGPDEPGWQRKVEHHSNPTCWIELTGREVSCAALRCAVDCWKQSGRQAGRQGITVY